MPAQPAHVCRDTFVSLQGQGCARLPGVLGLQQQLPRQWCCTILHLHISAGLMCVWIINLGMESAPCQGPLKSALKKVESKRTEEQGENRTQGKHWIPFWDACRRQKSGSWHCPRAAPEGSTQRSKQRTFGSTHEQELSKQKLFLHPLSFRI